VRIKAGQLVLELLLIDGAKSRGFLRGFALGFLPGLMPDEMLANGELFVAFDLAGRALALVFLTHFSLALYFSQTLFGVFTFN
jgi:hypothetical protein